MLQLTDKLYKAVESSDVEAVREFMNKGANVNLVSSRGRTALGRAAELGHLAIVCLLLDAEKFGECPNQTQAIAEASNLRQALLSVSSPKSLPVTTNASSVCFLGSCENSFGVSGEDAVAKEIITSSFAQVESLPVTSLAGSARRNSSTAHFSKASSLNSPLMHNHSGSVNCLIDSNLVGSVNPSCSATAISRKIVSNEQHNGCSSGARPKTNGKNKCNRRSKKLIVQSSSSLSFGEDESSKKCKAFGNQATVDKKKNHCIHSSDSDWSGSCENMCSKHSQEYYKSFEKAHCHVQEVFNGNSYYLSDSYSDVLGSPCDNIITSSSSENSGSQNDLVPPNYNNTQSCVPFEKSNFQLVSKQITSEKCTYKTVCVGVRSPTVCDITDALSLNNSSNTLFSSSQSLGSSHSKDDTSIPLSIYSPSHCCDKVDCEPKVSPLSSSVPSPKSTSYIPCCSNGSQRQPASTHCSIPVTIGSKNSKSSASPQSNKDASKSQPTAVQALAGAELLARKMFVATPSNASFVASEMSMKGSAVTAKSKSLASHVSTLKRVSAAASEARLEHSPGVILSRVESRPNAVRGLTGTTNCPPAIPIVINKHGPAGKSLQDNSSDCNPEHITPSLPLTPGKGSVKGIPCTDPLTFLVKTRGSTVSLPTVTNITWSLDDTLLGRLENHNCCSQKQKDKSRSDLAHELKQRAKNSSLRSNESVDRDTVKDLSVSDCSLKLFPKSVEQGATIIRNVRRQPNIGYYIMAHEDTAESDRPACRSSSQREPLPNFAHLPASPHPGHSSLDDAMLTSGTFTLNIERTSVCSVTPTLATPTMRSGDSLAAINSSQQMHQGCASVRASAKISVSRDNAPVSISEQSPSCTHTSRNNFPSDHQIAGSSARLPQSHAASTASASSSVLDRLQDNALPNSPVDLEGFPPTARSRHYRTSNSNDDSSASGQSPLSSDSDGDSRLRLKRKRLRHSKKDFLHQASSAFLPFPLSSADDSQSPRCTRDRSVTNKLLDHGAKSRGVLLTQKKQKKHKEPDFKNNRVNQEHVEVQDNCSCLEGAEVKDHEECGGDEKSQFLIPTQDVTDGVSVQADAAIGGGWSVAQWYNSRWGAELREQYQSVGAAWPWALTSACDCDVVDRHGSTALHYAAYAGHDHIVAVLLNAGASVDRTDGEELTALHMATERGAFTVVDTLLNRGASVNSRGPNKNTALHMAASRGHTALVDLLLSHGGRLNSLDAWERTPLMASASRGHVDTTRVLVERGAALNVHDIHGYTALCEAVWLESEPLVRLLLEAGGTASQSQHLLHYAVQHRNLPLTHLLLHHGWVVNLKDDTGAMPLMIAARTSSPETMELLLQHGANPNARHWVTGCSALHCAVEGTRDEQHDQFTELFRLLVAAGAHLSVSAQLDGDTPLYRALLLQKIRAAELLIRHGASLQCGTPVLGLELLRVAVYGNNRRLALLLVLAGCPLHPCRWLDAGPFPSGSLHHTIARLRANPFRLFDLSRIAVRRLLGERLVQTAPLLPLPTLLQRALLIVGDEEGSGEE